MPHDIIDNRTEKLVDAIRRVGGGVERARLSGLRAVGGGDQGGGRGRTRIGEMDDSICEELATTKITPLQPDPYTGYTAMQSRLSQTKE